MTVKKEFITDLSKSISPSTECCLKMRIVRESLKMRIGALFVLVRFLLRYSYFLFLL